MRALRTVSLPVLLLGAGTVSSAGAQQPAVAAAGYMIEVSTRERWLRPTRSPLFVPSNLRDEWLRVDSERMVFRVHARPHAPRWGLGGHLLAGMDYLTQ